MNAIGIIGCLITLGVLAVSLAITWRKRVAFEIRIADGKALLKRGRPRASFLSDVAEIAARNEIRAGSVRGIGSGRTMRLKFSKTISEPAKQQMRNAWSLLR